MLTLHKISLIFLTQTEFKIKKVYHLIRDDTSFNKKKVLKIVFPILFKTLDMYDDANSITWLA